MTPAARALPACAVLLAAALAACQGEPSAADPLVAEAPAGAADAARRTEHVRRAEEGVFDIEVTITPRAWTAPGLGEAIATEATDVVDDVIRRARERRGETPGRFAPSDLRIVWTAAYDAPEALSLLGETRLYEGGFTTAVSWSTRLYDYVAGREIGFADLFDDPRPDGAAMTAISEAAFANWAETAPSVDRDLAFVDERTLRDARAALRPRAGSFETFTLVAAEDDPARIAGVRLYYPAGALGPREDGPMSLFISAAALAPHVAPRWAALLVEQGETP